MRQFYDCRTFTAKSSILKSLQLMGILLMLLWSMNTNADPLQNLHTIKGNVKAKDDGQAIPGVTVVIKGKTKGTITDLNGDFTLEVSDKDIVVISSIGFKTQEIAVVGRTTFDILLETNDTKLDEIVVVGYGSMKKSDLSGSTVSVSSEKLKSGMSTSVDQALQGKAAGIQVTQTSGAPGSSVSFRIRGTSTINSDAEPLYVVDGVPLASSSINNNSMGLGNLGAGGRSVVSSTASLNPNDIESVEILKDASATAIYGSRGANGVILITTKHGKPGEAKFTYDGSYGVQTITTRLKMMNLQQYATYHNAYSDVTSSIAKKPGFADPSLLGAGTDWQNAIFQNAAVKNHQLSFSGGTEKSKYAASVGYLDQEGTIIGSGFKRLSARVNQDSKLKDWLSVNTSMSYTNTNERLLKVDGEDGLLLTALSQTPDVPVYNFDGTYASGDGENAKKNSVSDAYQNITMLGRQTINGNISADINPFPYFTFHSEYGGNVSFNDALSFLPTYDYGTGARNSKNSISRTKSQNSFYQVKNYLTFNKKIGEHDISAMIGHEASEWSWLSQGGSSAYLPSEEIKSISLGQPATMTASDDKQSGALQSFYGRVNYSLMSKYYLTATLRRDGSSNFSESNRYATFPALAVSWRISQENFLKNIAMISNLKFRAGWGVTGNQNIPSYKYGTTMANMPTNLGQGFRVGNYPNQDISWESSSQVNFGIDLSILKNRIDLTFDYYDKTSKNMLMEYPLPAYMGGLGEAVRLANPWGNFGEINNRGFEITLSTQNLKGAFTWSTDFSFSHNKNRLIDLGLGDVTLDGNVQWFTLISRVDKGQELGTFYGYKVAGVFKDKADIINSPRQYKVDANGKPVLTDRTNVWVGDLKYQDINGDNVIDEKDKTSLGSPQPLFTFGLNNTFSYKDFSLSVFVTGSYGNKLYNFVRQGRESTNYGTDNTVTIFKNQLSSVLDYSQIVPIDANKQYPAGQSWQDDIDNVTLANANPSMPRISNIDPNANRRTSDRYIEDGSYIRIKTLSLSYNVPAQWLKIARVSSLKLNASIQNLYTFTKYTGYDPEIGQDNLVSTLYGVDNGRYPSARTVTFGVSLNF